MSLDHLEQLARAAGFAIVPDDAEEAYADTLATIVPATIRYRTPDAPAPRALTPRALTKSIMQAAPVRTFVTSAFGQALRSAQSLIAARGAHA